MTWGSHCPQCGSEDCGWVRGPICEGNLDSTVAALRAELEEAREVLRAFIALESEWHPDRYATSKLHLTARATKLLTESDMALSQSDTYIPT